MNRTTHAASALLLALAIGAPAPAPANTLELALVIDGSGSIPASDWLLQIGAYQGVFQDNFYTNLIQPSAFDNIVVAAYVFSGGNSFTSGSETYEISVASFLDWTQIENDTDAFNFGAQFAGLPQPGGSTDTTQALNVATFGGLVSCPFPDICSPEPLNVSPFQITATGLLNNAFTGDAMVIDISTDGVPTEPNGGGTPNQADRDLAIAKANEIRGNGITINAIGVGGLDTTFLEALVGMNPAVSPGGFFVTADTFSEFGTALREKIGREVVPAPPAGLLLLTGIAGVLLRRSRRFGHTRV